MKFNSEKAFKGYVTRSDNSKAIVEIITTKVSSTKTGKFSHSQSVYFIKTTEGSFTTNGANLLSRSKSKYGISKKAYDKKIKNKRVAIAKSRSKGSEHLIDLLLEKSLLNNIYNVIGIELEEEIINNKTGCVIASKCKFKVLLDDGTSFVKTGKYLQEQFHKKSNSLKPRKENVTKSTPKDIISKNIEECFNKTLAEIGLDNNHKEEVSKIIKSFSRKLLGVVTETSKTSVRPYTYLALCRDLLTNNFTIKTGSSEHPDKRLSEELEKEFPIQVLSVIAILDNHKDGIHINHESKIINCFKKQGVENDLQHLSGTINLKTGNISGEFFNAKRAFKWLREYLTQNKQSVMFKSLKETKKILKDK